MATRKISGQNSWLLRTADVEAALTRQAGHLGPVRFRLGNRWIAPYDLAPWAEEKLAADTPPILKTLRGDFFCLPFGGNEQPYRGEQHPPHGQTANDAWQLQSADGASAHCLMNTSVRQGRVDKIIRLIPGHTAVYSQHIVSGMSGRMSFGHHAILKLPAARAGRVSASRFRYGQVFPGDFERPADGGYSILKPGAKFSSLHRVARVDDKFADLTIYPDREGYEDLVLIAAETFLPYAWTALTVPGERYVWFALKNPRILPSTLFWMSNGGRHYAPWNSRHRHVIGMEEVCSYFDRGLAASAKHNPLNEVGIPTCHRLNPKRPLTVNYIMALAEIPGNFDIVKTIRPADDKKNAVLVSQSGKIVTTPLDWSFLSAEPS